MNKTGKEAELMKSGNNQQKSSDIYSRNSDNRIRRFHPVLAILFFSALLFVPGCGAKVSEKDMKQAYQQAEAKNTADEWKSFLKKFPKHPEKAKIEQKIAKLEEALKELETVKQKNDWNSWKEYISKHPAQMQTDETWNHIIEAAAKEFKSKRYVSFGKGKYLKKYDLSISLNFKNLSVFGKIAERADKIDPESINRFGITLSMASQDELDPCESMIYLAQIDELFEGSKFKSKELNSVLAKIRKASLTASTTPHAKQPKSTTTPAQKILQMVFGKKFEKAQEMARI